MPDAPVVIQPTVQRGGMIGARAQAWFGNSATPFDHLCRCYITDAGIPNFQVVQDDIVDMAHAAEIVVSLQQAIAWAVLECHRG